MQQSTSNFSNPNLNPNFMSEKTLKNILKYKHLLENCKKKFTPKQPTCNLKR